MKDLMINFRNFNRRLPKILSTSKINTP